MFDNYLIRKDSLENVYENKKSGRIPVCRADRGLPGMFFVFAQRILY